MEKILILIIIALTVLTGCNKSGPVEPGAGITDYYLVDNCEDANDKNFLNGKWYTNYDTFGDTIMYPRMVDIFYMSQYGSPETPKYCARVTGYLGPQAGTRPDGKSDDGYYAFGGMVMNLAPVTNYKPVNASNFTGVRFYLKFGDVITKAGAPLRKEMKFLLRRVRTDDVTGAEFEYTITSAPLAQAGEWELIQIPFSSITQPSWVASGPKGRTPTPYNDLLALYFYPNTEVKGQNFDIMVDDIGFYK